MKKYSKIMSVVFAVVLVLTSATLVSARDASTDSMLSELVTPVPNIAIDALSLEGLSVGTQITPTGGSVSNASGSYQQVVYVPNSSEKYFWQVFQGHHSGDKKGWEVKATESGEKYLYRAPENTNQSSHSRLAINTNASGTGTGDGAASYMIDGTAYVKQVTQFDFKFDTIIDKTWFQTGGNGVVYDNVTYLARFYRDTNAEYSGDNWDQYLTLYFASNGTGAESGEYTILTNHWGNSGQLNDTNGNKLPFKCGKWYTARIVTDIKTNDIYFYYFDENGVQINSENDDYYLLNHVNYKSKTGNNINSVSNKVEFGSCKLAPTSLKKIYTAKEAWEMRVPLSVTHADNKATAKYSVIKDVLESSTQTYMTATHMASNQSPHCLVAVYDNNNKLVGFNSAYTTEAARNTQHGYGNPDRLAVEVSAEFDTTNLPEGTYTVKGFIWNNLNKLVPYVAAGSSTFTK